MHQHVERFRSSCFRQVVALNDSFVSLRTANYIIGFNGKQFLKNVGSAISLERPHLHFSKTLTSELCLSTQRLLSNKRVRSDRTSVHLVVHHVYQLDHVNDTYGSFLVKTLSGFSV